MNGKYPHFAIPEIYGESLSYYELLRKLVKAMNVMIDNYNTVPEQIAEAVANLDASQLFSAVLNQLIHSIATDNTKSANAVKVYKKHDLLYATFNETVNLYESLIDFTTGAETELIVGTNIREVNISELFIDLRKLIDSNKNNIDAVTAVANENSSEITTMHNDITSIENKNTEQDNEITTIHGEITAIKNKNTEQDNELSTLRTMISSPYNFKGDVASISALPETGNVNDTYYVQDVKYKVTWTGSEWVQSSLNEADYQTELTALDDQISELKGDINNMPPLRNENLLKYATYTDGYYLSPDSTKQPNANYSYTNKLRCEPNKSYILKNMQAEFNVFFHFYDKNGDFISGDYKSPATHDITTPNNAYYIAFSCPIENRELNCIYYNYGQYEYDYIDGYYYIYDSGVRVPNDAMCYTTYISVTPNEVISVPSVNTHTCFFDKNKNYISGTLNKYFKIPSDCFYIITSTPISTKTSFTIKRNLDKIELRENDGYNSVNEALRDSCTCGVPLYIYGGEWEMDYTEGSQGFFPVQDIIGIGRPLLYKRLETFDVEFSIFFLSPYAYKRDITIDGVRFETRNCRYCIHDEMGGNATQPTQYYKHIIKNCEFLCDSRAYGCGLGDDGQIVIENCVFRTIESESLDESQLAFHTGSVTQYRPSTVLVSNCDVDGTVLATGLNFSGSGFMDVVRVSNNRLTSQPILENGEGVINMELISWNNEISNN